MSGALGIGPSLLSRWARKSKRRRETNGVPRTRSWKASSADCGRKWTFYRHPATSHPAHRPLPNCRHVPSNAFRILSVFGAAGGEEQGLRMEGAGWKIFPRDRTVVLPQECQEFRESRRSTLLDGGNPTIAEPYCGSQPTHVRVQHGAFSSASTGQSCSRKSDAKLKSHLVKTYQNTRSRCPLTRKFRVGGRGVPI